MAHNGRPRQRFIIVALTLAIAAALPGLSAAQQFKDIPPQVNVAQAKVLAAQVATILRDASAPNADAIKQLDSFFKGFLYPSMTSADPVALGQLAEKRDQLFQRYINAAKSQGARDHLIAITLQAMGFIAKGDFHPAARYNAVLILGQLDAQPGAKPLPAATDALLALLENEQFNNRPVPTGVKLAALVGLQRHVRLGVEPPVAERITSAALAVANREELPEDASAKAYGWVRRQAAEILAAQSAKGVTPPIYQTFVRLISDEKSDLDDRCAVAQLLQPGMFAAAQGLNLDDLALALGELAREVLEVEAEEANEFIDQMIGGGIAAPMARGFGGEGRNMYMEGGRGRGEFGGGEFGGGMGGGFGALPLDEGPKYEKRRLLDRILAIVAGAQAVAANAPDELKARLGEFSAAILAVAEAAAPDNATNEEITPAVVDLDQNIDRMVAAWAPAQPVEDAVIEEEPGEAPEQPEQPAAEEAPAAPAEAAGG